MSWRAEGAEVARLEASIARLRTELEAGPREHERRAIEAELAELQVRLEQARSGRKLL